MKKMYYWVYALIILSYLIFTSCEKKPNCPSDFDYYEALDDEENHLIDAYVEYIFDSSEEKCLIYRSALLDYIDEAEKIRECAKEAGQEDELQDEIDDARSDLDNLSC